MGSFAFTGLMIGCSLQIAAIVVAIIDVVPLQPFERLINNE